MTIRYHYNGVLTDQVAEWSRGLLQKYPYALEVSQMAPLREFDGLYADRSWVSYGEDCMGGATSSTRVGVPFAFVRKSDDVNDPTAFLFFGDLEASNRFVERFPELVINRNPFQTEFA